MTSSNVLISKSWRKGLQIKILSVPNLSIEIHKQYPHDLVKWGYSKYIIGISLFPLPLTVIT